MESILQITTVILGIVLNILAAILSLAYVYRSCVGEGLPGEIKRHYYEQAGRCFKYGNGLILFIWLVTSTAGDELIFSGMRIGIYSWALVAILSITCMLAKLVTRKTNAECITTLSSISTRSIKYLALLIFVFWFIS